MNKRAWLCSLFARPKSSPAGLVFLLADVTSRKELEVRVHGPRVTVV
jgi:hypothetical protein